VVVVVDTNVFVGACLGTGAANRVIEACIRCACRPLMGAALFAEHEDVLSRTSLFAKGRLNAREREELFDIYLATCRWTRIYFGWRPNLRDEGDNHLIELAVAGGATHVITRNVLDFRGAELRFPDIAIVTPAQYLREVAP
jgi:putative PIN family toxin of toxin-antitoxin system